MQYLAGDVGRELQKQDAIHDVADLAHAALSGTPASVRPRPEPPSRGRIRLELLSDDGRVLAEGHAMAALTPSPLDTGTSPKAASP